MIKAMVATVLSLAIVFQGLGSTKPAEAASCSVAGGQSGQLKYSGQLNSISATVCGNQIWKLVGKPKKPSKPIKKVKGTKPKKYANNFTVLPDKPSIGGASSADAGSKIELLAIAQKHIRNRLLFWYPSQVSFKPKTFVWNFGDGQTGEGRSVSHAWSKAGNYQVKLLVGYSVKYRIVGHSSWVALTGLVYASSTPVTVKIGSSKSKTNGNVLLVHWGCNQKPDAPGC